MVWKSNVSLHNSRTRFQCFVSHRIPQIGGVSILAIRHYSNLHGLRMVYGFLARLIRCHLVPKDHLAAKKPSGPIWAKEPWQPWKACCYGNQ